MSVTIHDVAKAAGVSLSTVSRAFNGYKDINDTTRQRIFDAAQELGYIPNINARNLASKNTVSVALVTSGIVDDSQTDEIVQLIAKGACTFAAEKGIEFATYYISTGFQGTKTCDQFCREHGLDGIIVFGLRQSDPYYLSLLRTTVPCVSIDLDISGPHLGNVHTNNVEAFKELTLQCIRNGHRKFAMFNGRLHTAVSAERLSGAYQALQENGLELNSTDIIDTDFSAEIAHNCMMEYLKKNGKNGATAFLCASDWIAIGVLQAILEMGYSVPGDFSLVGFDGLLISQFVYPPLMTVRQDMYTKGYRAIELLSKIISHTNVVNDIYVPYQLIQGRSVGPVPTEN